MAKSRSSALIIKGVRFDGRPTSIALEQEFWDFLREIATEKRVHIGRLRIERLTSASTRMTRASNEKFSTYRSTNFSRYSSSAA